MKTTILLVGHGSRNPAGNAEILELASRWSAANPGRHIETCFIEFAEPLLDEGLDRAADGAGQVIVVPLILNAAGHVKREIPHHIDGARRRHPGVEFRYARPLGATWETLTILRRNLHEAMGRLDHPDPRNTGVVLLGRGSSDRTANGEVAKMGRWLFEESEHEMVDIAFTGITHPRLESVVQRQAMLGMNQVVVLPYYLFTGTLIERIRRQLAHLDGQYPRLRFAGGDYFGFEQEIMALLDRRVREASGAEGAQSMMECDGCPYRERAGGHDHGHHHHHKTDAA